MIWYSIKFFNICFLAFFFEVFGWDSKAQVRTAKIDTKLVWPKPKLGTFEEVYKHIRSVITRYCCLENKEAAFDHGGDDDIGGNNTRNWEVEITQLADQHS